MDMDSDIQTLYTTALKQKIINKLKDRFVVLIVIYLLHAWDILVVPVVLVKSESVFL